jgi:hypothetical protein
MLGAACEPPQPISTRNIVFPSSVSSRCVSGARSTILFGGVGFNTLSFSAEYAVEHTAMRIIINVAGHIFLPNCTSASRVTNLLIGIPFGGLIQECTLSLPPFCNLFFLHLALEFIDKLPGIFRGAGGFIGPKLGAVPRIQDLDIVYWYLYGIYTT